MMALMMFLLAIDKFGYRGLAQFQLLIRDIAKTGRGPTKFFPTNLFNPLRAGGVPAESDAGADSHAMVMAPLDGCFWQIHTQLGAGGHIPTGPSPRRTGTCFEPEHAMIYDGRVENGMVVTNQPLPLPDGTPVRVEPMTPPADFWRPVSLDELARMQGVSPPASIENLVGGWPADELDDGFEDALMVWRAQESGSHP